jgi:hypothetical protein
MFLSCLAVFLIGMGSTEFAFGGSAEVLPKGVWSVLLDNRTYLPVEKKFDKNGNIVSAANDFNAVLDSSVFSDLGSLESAFNLPKGSANIGASEVSFKYNFNFLDTYVLYGATDRLTLGVKIPYVWASNTVNANLNTTNATIGKNPLFGTPLDPTGGQAPLVPIGAFGPNVPIPTLTNGDVQHLLGAGLDVNGDGTIDIPGFGYKPVQNWSNNGIGDIEIGGRYQYYKSDNWRLATLLGIRFPTGETDDPDNLVDFQFGAGAAALLFQLNNDYVGIKNLVLDATLRYDLYLPHKQIVRVPDNVDVSITSNKETVDKKIGDLIAVELSATYMFLKGATAGIQYKYGHGFKDKVSGSKGFNYSSLEEQSDFTDQVIEASLGYSTIPLYVEKKFAVPMNVSVTYRNRFKGNNDLLKSEYIGLGLQFYF